MTEHVPTIAAALDMDYERPSADQIAALRASTAFSTLLLGAGTRVSPAFVADAASSLGRALKTALGTPVTSILASGWNTYRPFLKYRDATRYPPEAVAQETLLKHTVDLSLHPRVRLMLDGNTVGEVAFEATLAITLDGGTLFIQGGRFVKLRPGKCHAAGTLECEGALLVEVKSRTIELPGEVRLGNSGIPIGPRARPTAAPVPAHLPPGAAAPAVTR